MRAAMILVVLGLTACGSMEPTYPVYETDQTLRIERFDACMASLPIGPTNTHYNDWAEVVEACDDVSLYQARRCVDRCPAWSLEK